MKKYQQFKLVINRSVHNVRIERLWRDVTQAFGIKWYNLFHDLELNGGLCPDDDCHIWLLHHLFLQHINDDALIWAKSWNSHTMQLHGAGRDRSPQDMFFFGVLEHGLRGPPGMSAPVWQSGPPPDEEEVENIDAYGVDWEDLSNPEILGHHQQNNEDDAEFLGPANGEDGEPLGPVNTRQPPQLSLVEVPDFACPFENQEDLDSFVESLMAAPEYGCRDVQSYKGLWARALELLHSIISVSN
ncbi:hypothetical protein C8R42DRAFT_594176 [Lentinula raphanica]|nr:hypothetical protein C8R42DRAFT_594176 [Lentinula raphanica]